MNMHDVIGRIIMLGHLEMQIFLYKNQLILSIFLPDKSSPYTVNIIKKHIRNISYHKQYFTHVLTLK